MPVIGFSGKQRLSFYLDTVNLCQVCSQEAQRKRKVRYWRIIVITHYRCGYQEIRPIEDTLRNLWLPSSEYLTRGCRNWISIHQSAPVLVVSHAPTLWA